jgi:hypothetical protein
MAYESLLVKNVYIARWLTPELADGPAMLKDAREGFEKVGKQLLFLSVAPVHSPPPPDDLRKYLGEHVKEMLAFCSEMHVVIEGAGFGQSVKRMAMASVVLISGMRKKMFVHNSVRGSIESMPLEHRAAVSAAIIRAEAEGVLIPWVPDTSSSQT